MNQNLMEEMNEKHRTIKAELLKILEQFDKRNIRKQELKDRLFKLYLEIK